MEKATPGRNPQGVRKADRRYQEVGFKLADMFTFNDLEGAWIARCLGVQQ
jgi:hypothetical protein